MATSCHRVCTYSAMVPANEACAYRSIRLGLAARTATEADLDNIVAKRLLRRVEDVTTYSQSLMAELAKVGPPRGSARNLPPLAESQNNLTTAHRHFVSRAALEQGRLARLASAAKIDSARDWLENASANMLYVGERLKPETLKGCAAPTGEWLDILD